MQVTIARGSYACREAAAKAIVSRELFGCLVLAYDTRGCSEVVDGYFSSAEKFT